MIVVVVGGGVIGLSCAFALSSDGAEVTVLEAGRTGAGASAGNAGWVTPSLGTPLAAPGILRVGLRSALDPRGALVIRPRLDPDWLRWLWRFARSSRPEAFRAGVTALLGLTRRTLAELDRMAAAGVEFEQHRAGLLAVARSHEGLHWFETLFDELRALGFEGGLDALGRNEAVALEPALGPDARVAVHATVDRHVDPMSLTQGLRAYLGDRGVPVREHSPVTRLHRDGERWRVELAGGELLAADRVVLSCAGGTAELLRPFGVRVPVVGAKGYSVTVPHAHLTPRLPLYLCEPKLGLTPLAAGLRIAGFFELGARDSQPSAARARQLVEETVPFLAELDRSSFAEGPDGWAGLRPCTPDSLPLLGPVAGAPGLIVATGHGMLGVTLAPATGLAVASLVRGETPGWVAPFAVDRGGI